MAVVKPFRGLRPPPEIVKKLACLPYDVMSTGEAALMARNNEYSLLHITRSEIDLPENTDPHSEDVYDKSIENFTLWKKRGWLKQDDDPYVYIYAQTMEGRTQYGIVACASVDDYMKGNIKEV